MIGFEVLMFDLGGVLVDFTGLVNLSMLFPSVDIEEIRHKWLMSPVVKKFETGRCNADEFSSEFIEEWNLDITPEKFLAEFKSWASGPFDGAVELLESLRSNYTLVCLTNSNEIHWDCIKDVMGFDVVFHHLFSSHMIGAAKPDKAAFDYVLNCLEVKPEKVAFFDDNHHNVDSARSLGINAYVVRGLPELIQRLQKLEIIPYPRP
ncbi:MAG: HAD family phosphatase [Deltaproteobacteria bacterium]|nr:HAD family phosphatase [Deltaproteobacteria bacterium]